MTIARRVESVCGYTVLRTGQRVRETKGTYVVVIVLASDSNEGALLWSSLTWSLVPESIDNEREERVCVSVSGRSNDSEVCVHACLCLHAKHRCSPA